MKAMQFKKAENNQHNDDRLDKLLHRRMKLPQRHRLLHTFPLLASMPRLPVLSQQFAVNQQDTGQFIPNADRGLLVGVLPHPFCNPTVRGCGFCTFPHEQYRASSARALVDAVISEITLRQAADSSISNRPVRGLYIGGGTANLTPVDSLRKLAATLQDSFDLRQAEVTLEGVPVYFLKREKPFDVLLDELDGHHFRISMGIQTFDGKQLKRMGRLAFGSRKTFGDVVSYAHQAGMTVSADLLFNLPFQSLSAMREDVKQSIELGLDQICLYHLVLFRGLGTEWSRDPHLLNGLPSNEEACDNWVTLRDMLLAAGYIQTTLTNFEHISIHRTDRRFSYENDSFRPNKFDMLGFGPSGISFYANNRYTQGVKVTNVESAAEYVRRIEQGESVLDRLYDYTGDALRVFYLMRRLAALEIGEQEYQRQFGIPHIQDFSGQLRVLLNADLLQKRGRTYIPTPRGMFYADAMASLLTERSKAELPRYKATHQVIHPGNVSQSSNMAGHM